jgi:tRNA1Val (adenine37-N6)-methyltransferase
MLAQRSKPEAIVDAVELHAADAQQAVANVLGSPWPGKVNVIQDSIQSYMPDRNYDLIVTNPPYFSNSLHPPDPKRAEVRHDARLTRSELLDATIRLLGQHGTFALILPAREAEPFRLAARVQGLHLQTMTNFRTRLTKPPERVLLAFTRIETNAPVINTLVLYDSENRKSASYQQMTGEFYL